MKKWSSLISIIISIGMAILCPVTARANSLVAYWWGESANTVVLMNENCPIEVKNECLTFDLQEFPETEYKSVKTLLDYSGKVTAEYTFYNPTDETVTALLEFPFGNCPYDVYDGNFWEGYADDTEKYDILIDGNVIEKRLRYTLEGYDEFDPDTAKDKLKDEYVDDEFYYPEMTVTKYTFKINEFDMAVDEADVVIKMFLDFDSSKTKLFLADESWGWSNESGRYEVEFGAADEISFCILGEDLETEPEWEFYSGYGEDDGTTKIDGEAVLVEKENESFEAFAFDSCEWPQGISKSDFYNVFVDLLCMTEEESGIVNWSGMIYEGNFMTYLMRWYEYEITIEPGETVVNTVTAPIYPSIDGAYTPKIYTYTYLLSPAKGWSDFGTLEIKINTPFYLTKSSENGFEKTENGYILSRNGLPDRELEFALSEDEHPHYDRNWGYIFCFIILPVIIVMGIVAIFVVLQKSRKQTKE